MNDNETLQNQYKQLEGENQAKRGENSILRSKMDKDKIEHERYIASMQALQVQEKQKLADQLHQKRDEIEQMKAESAFLTRELKDVVLEHSKLNKTLKAKEGSANNAPWPAARPDVLVTPKKTKKFADGFDSNDLGAYRGGSPIPVPGSRTKATPSRTSAKRKRSGPESGLKPSQQTAHLMLSQNYPPSSQASRQESFEEEDEEAAFDAMIDNLTLEDMDLEYDDRQQVCFPNLHSCQRRPLNQ